MIKGLWRYPFYWFLVLLAFPLLVTGWYADQGLVRFQDELSERWLKQKLDQELAALHGSPAALADWVLLPRERERVFWVGPQGLIEGQSPRAFGEPAGLEPAVQGILKGEKLEPKPLWPWVVRPLDALGLPDQRVVYFSNAQALQDSLLPFRRFFWTMVVLGGLAACCAALYFKTRVQAPIALILKKNKEFQLTGNVQAAQIDPSLIGSHDLGEIMHSRNQVLELTFLERARNEIIFNSLHDALFVFSPNRKILKVNFPAAMLLQRSEAELRGLQVEDLVAQPDQPWLKLWWNNYNFASTHPTFEARFRTKDGAELPVLCSAEMLINPLGQFDGMLLVCRDLSQAKALQQQVDLLSLVTEQSPVGVMVLGPAGEVSYVNPALERITGQSGLELRSKPAFFFGPSLRSEGNRLALLEAFQQKRPWTGDFDSRRANGEPYWERVMLVPVGDANGRDLGVTLLREEITESKRLESLLQETNKELEKKVEERVKELQTAKEELERANAALQSLDKLKDEFLATVSHELRTPLAAMIGYAESMLDVPMEPEVRERFLKVILSEGERLSLLINEVLDLSAIAAGKLEFHFTRLDLDSLMAQVCDSLSSLSGAKSVALAWEPSKIQFDGDNNRMIQLLINLVGNAIKFSPEGKEVRLRAEPQEGSFLLEVRDQGLGIPPAALEQIFDRFKQIESPMTQKKGTGLGLTLARMIVEAHGGKIWAENCHPGARFLCRLPYNQESVNV